MTSLEPTLDASRILITGVGSGIGLGLAVHAIDQGAKLWSLGRSLPEALSQRGHTRHVACDLRRLDAIAEALGRLLDGVEGLDLVVLNAGVLPPIADLADTSLETCRETMDVNLWANKLLLDALFEREIEVERVVAISSGAAVNGNRGWNAYALSKAALNMLVQLYAKERESTHFVALAPGLVDTKMQDYLCSRDETMTATFPSLGRIQSARGTETMPTPQAVAGRLYAAMEQLRRHPSGSFADIRKL